MTVSAELLSILACPSLDHAPLRLLTADDGAAELECSFCESRFPVRDGIPVLLADEAVVGPNGLGNAATPAADVSPEANASPEADGGPVTDGGLAADGPEPTG